MNQLSLFMKINTIKKFGWSSMVMRVEDHVPETNAKSFVMITLA